MITLHDLDMRVMTVIEHWSMRADDLPLRHSVRDDFIPDGQCFAFDSNVFYDIVWDGIFPVGLEEKNFDVYRLAINNKVDINLPVIRFKDPRDAVEFRLINEPFDLGKIDVFTLCYEYELEKIKEQEMLLRCFDSANGSTPVS